MIMLMAISLLLCVGLLICGCKTNEDGFAIASAFFGIVFIVAMISFPICMSSAKMDTMQAKAIIENPQGYTHKSERT